MKKITTAFCPTCGCKTACKVNSRIDSLTIRGVEFNYVELFACCSKCGEEVYLPEINDANVTSRENAYRSAAKLITVPQINEILEKYHIGAGPLAKIMGFGEVTINRYLNGQLPSKANSDKLNSIRNSYKNMEKYLENSKDELTSAAYMKCREALDELDYLYGEDKIELVTRYILHKSSDVTPMALQKILYYAQAFFPIFYGTPLFTNTCQAWPHGPVYPEVYFKYREFGYDPIKIPDIEFTDEDSGLTSIETDFLDAVFYAFGRYSGSTLRNITHKEPPWIEARGSLAPLDHSETVINPDTINTYFSSIYKKYNMVTPHDIINYSKYMAKSIYYI